MKEIFAHRFKTARLVSGISQKELADNLSITKQAVSKYEKGLMLPDSTALLKIADILDYKPDYFFRPLTVKLDSVEFRKRSSLKGRRLATVKAQVIDKLERYLELEELMNIINDFDNPISNITIRRVNDVENACNQLLAAWKLGSNPLPNILEMVEDNGIKVIEMDAENSFDGLSTWIGKIPVIVVN
ncbi:MAG: helix-turn-helix transcriptional regulator, partial [Bacteroidota bacterium]